MTYSPLVGYSTNVHKSHDLHGVYRLLRDYTLPIKRRVYGSGAAGLELHLNIGSTTDLLDRRTRREFKEFLDESGLVIFSVNAYPLSDFHAKRVKETVYKPLWAQNDRARWTSAIARVVSDLLPDGVDGSISTLGGCFRGHGHGPTVFRKMAGFMVKSLETFLQIRERTGKKLVLAFEPEPETTFETSADVVTFFEKYLLPAARERWRHRGSRARIEADLRDVFSVNIDTCHLSVLFEGQVSNLRKLEKAGIRLGKIHVTNAVALRNPYRSPAAYRDLQAMDEPRYFHQFCGVDAMGNVAWRGKDLDELPRELDRTKHPDVAEIRSHFHVPLYLKKLRRLHTTRDDTEIAIREVLKRRTTEHLVFETYTWPILAGAEDQREKLITGITREYRWLLGVIERSGR